MKDSSVYNMTSGIGRVIIPKDIDREKYINSVRKTGLLILENQWQDIIHNVRVDLELVEKLKFPQQVEQYGSDVVWIKVPVINMVIIVAILITNTSSKSTSEGEISNFTSFGQKIIISEINSSRKGSYSIVANLDDQGVGITFKTVTNQGVSYFLSGVGGIAKMYGDNSLECISASNVKIKVMEDDRQVGFEIDIDGVVYSDHFGNSIIIDDSSFQFETSDLFKVVCGSSEFEVDLFKIGNGSTSGVRNGELADTITQIHAILTKLATAVNGFVPGTVLPQELLDLLNSIPKFESNKLKID